MADNDNNTAVRCQLQAGRVRENREIFPIDRGHPSADRVSLVWFN
jgi:hypothetical protein